MMKRTDSHQGACFVSSAQLSRGALMNIPDFLERFATKFQQEMFRLETLDYYGGEDDLLNEWLGGGAPPLWADDMPWRVNVREKIAEGKTCSRVHLVQEPLSSYLQWEIKWGYPQNAALGEHIRVVRMEELANLAEEVRKNPLLKQDFVLLDDRLLFFVRYDAQNNYLGHELIEDETSVKDARELKRSLMALGNRVPPTQSR
jgi:hypothetical protein